MSQDGAQGRYAGGAVAGGRYQLRDLLGEGGMASVYLAYDSALDRQVAIKTLHTELGREQSFRERFRREAQAVAKLQHTNIVSVFDTGEDELGGALMPYIVMEYVEGQPLGSVLAADIRQYGAMPADKALKVTADVLAALETSHEMGLVHRDIKPGNVMMTKRGIVKVMDFGIARAMQSGVTSMTQTGMVVGTPQYLSPEQALGRGVDARSDLYSVGIMLFQLLTGRIPFDADSPLAIAYAHVQEEPVAPSSINRSVTPAMDALVARALKKNPNERFPSAAAMRDEIARVLNASGGRTGAPAIVAGGGPANSGAGVGSAVFPPVDQATPAPQSVQTPYQPHPHQQPQHPGPYNQPAPTPAPGYGYPQAAQSYPTPGPLAHQTPPPYTINPQHQTAVGTTGGGSSQRNMPVIVGSIVVALLAVGGLITALALQGGGKDDEAGKGGDPGTSETSTDEGYRPPERNRTMKSTKCTDALEDSDDPQKVQAPNFVYKDILSAKACAAAAGWTIKEIEEPGNTYAEGQVVGQFPSSGAAVAEQGAHFELKVSTGRPS
ncbi:protein kinase domain-containing protein [Streptomyces microflavus]|uniref:non-specific serine/threonine protein kinase n=2 Tax=Streptomyces microflavus TaxID=1919 RepID=A0A7J0CS59_STRMI|nr:MULTISPECIES: protein kinase [Streptomyces]AGK78409.1 Serine/threonine protein kinase [Streptomyces microflavus DSM 40593]MDX2979576.1 protein kinase [Streptomyces sp. NRRL_B-2249]WSS35477.1 protein kinase [Streptomyces microflavus]WST15956.1 protein kinase [Streptomyces microflavus]GFN05303.1 serine/threonine-protein kinase PksC [Streptomyces microflavus]